MTEKRPKFFYGYAVTAAAFAIWFVGWGTFVPAFGVFLKPLLAEFNWSRADASLGYSLSTLVRACLSISIGWLTDKAGPRMVMTLFGSFLGISYLLLSRVDGLLEFQVIYGLVGGIGASTLTAPIMATISRWFVKRRGMMIGVVQAGMGVGGFLFPPFVGWLILSYGWRFSYVVLGLITLTVMIAAGSFLRRDPRDIGLLPDGEQATEKSTKGPSTEAQRATRRSIWEILRTGQFWIIAGIYATFGFCRSGFTVHIAAHVQDLGFSLIDGANILAVITGTSILGRVGMGRVADQIGTRIVFMVSFGVTALSLILGVVARDLWVLYVFAFLFGLGWGNQAVLRFALTSEVFGVASLGLMMGIFAVAEAAAATFAAYFAGYIYDVLGSYSIVFMAGIALSIMGIGFAAMLKPVGVS